MISLCLFLKIRQIIADERPVVGRSLKKELMPSVYFLPQSRYKLFLWLFAVVVLLQLLFFIADLLRKDSVLFQDCSAAFKTPGCIPRQVNIKLLALHSDALKLSTNSYSQENDVILKERATTGENQSSNSGTSVSTKTQNESSLVTNFTRRSELKGSSSDAGETQYDCRRLSNRSSLSGYLNVHEWYGWCGYAVDDLRREPRFPLKPHVIGRLQRFATEVTVRRNSGRRIFGYIHPPVTGNFLFAISSADGSELWLSADDDPQNSRKIAYLGDPENQYAATTRFSEFTSRKSQISEKIRLEAGRAYYVEVLQKQKKNQEHVEVAWQLPGKDNLAIIQSQHLSQYIDYSAEEEEIRNRTICICKNHPTLSFAFNKFMTQEKYDIRDDFHTRVETLPHSAVSDALPSCPYSPSYLVSRKLAENEAIVKGYIKVLRVFPDDKSDVNMSHVINDHISWGNKKIPKKESLQIVSSYMKALNERKGKMYALKNIVNVEDKVDPKKGIRYLVELELEDITKGRSFRLSEYIYRPYENTTGICYPKGFQWRRDTTVSMIVTVKNYGPWIKFLISQLALIYKRGYDRNFFLVIVDFNSTDVDIFKLREKSGIKDRIAIIQKFTEFHKTKALNEAVASVKDPDSIIFTADLHISFPPNIFDEIRKHTIQGRSFYSPAVLKLKCGYSITHQQASWEMMGYGLFGGYKTDWDRFGGMDAEKFTTRWGGEDWDLMDRAIGANLEIERLRARKLYHYHHERNSDWYENARI
ncbi:N-acetyl-beta-glucosaminyl-glycoprotein 4-beta-N-acetylgalactosaminyltransferase 1-like isoform X2 [Montipora capricornis]|uniref:N-acetyl-beta-glucosaminyl-glycoprotein 4-beta-N-acetylgalactosaminyltransferase 1-like isoform X2 n=1 Tax=Montipora capricornis TaxID=246305 RepID=UPI0035F191EA